MVSFLLSKLWHSILHDADSFNVLKVSVLLQNIHLFILFSNSFLFFFSFWQKSWRSFVLFQFLFSQESPGLSTCLNFYLFSHALSETNANLRILCCFWEINYFIYSAQDGIWNLNLKFYFQSDESDHSDTRIVNRFIWKLFMAVLGVIYRQTPLANTLRNTVTVDATKVFTISILIWP